jgi:DNA-binding transcriptional LysR family regulator
VLVCSNTHPLAAAEEVGLKDFQQEDLFLLDMVGQNFAQLFGKFYREKYVIERIAILLENYP